jgi:hypothetical protein
MSTTLTTATFDDRDELAFLVSETDLFVLASEHAGHRAMVRFVGGRVATVVFDMFADQSANVREMIVKAGVKAPALKGYPASGIGADGIAARIGCEATGPDAWVGIGSSSGTVRNDLAFYDAVVDMFANMDDDDDRSLRDVVEDVAATIAADRKAQREADAPQQDDEPTGDDDGETGVSPQALAAMVARLAARLVPLVGADDADVAAAAALLAKVG